MNECSVHISLQRDLEKLVIREAAGPDFVALEETRWMPEGVGDR